MDKTASKKNLPVKTILLIVTVILAGLAALIAAQPSHIHVERSTVIGSVPLVVFSHVNNLRRWESWSPWADRDPEAKTSFSGPAAGVGAAMSWDGSETGAGTMTITESRPGERIAFRLDFTRPFKGTDTAQFTFRPEKGGTRVTWSMDGENNFITKAMSLVMDCDKMIGGEFEKGLATLKGVIERR